MARKQKSDKEIVVSSGAAAAVTRRKTASSRTKHSSAQAEMPAPVVEVPAPAVQAAEPSFDQVSKLAYSYWLERGCQGGSSEEDWLRAERELRSGVAVFTA